VTSWLHIEQRSACDAKDMLFGTYASLMRSRQLLQTDQLLFGGVIVSLMADAAIAQKRFSGFLDWQRAINIRQLHRPLS
jgi:hypothetical protein